MHGPAVGGRSDRRELGVVIGDDSSRQGKIEHYIQLQPAPDEGPEAWFLAFPVVGDTGSTVLELVVYPKQKTEAFEPRDPRTSK